LALHYHHESCCCLAADVGVHGFRRREGQADFLSTLPARFVAWTGLDALTHAVEATVGRAANPVSDALAEAAIGLLAGHLERAVADPDDATARAQTMRAATLAGLAFGNADVAGVHCLSESLGGLYDVPHGLANALLLVPVLRHLRPSVDRRLAELLPLLGEEGGEEGGGEGGGDATARADEALERVARLVAALDLPPFADFRVPAEDHPRIAALAVSNGSNPSNPRPMDETDYRAVLAALA
jgi:alcohol dehydrogenase